ncbi:MAG: TetR/AcrR family transcriptional regulator [Alphaproteobacteria bacterium]|nr:TetR/AcrR family transcriptional regulator [Alphaproteobacteria bacterium]MBT4018241.1 TetR/AcrR family transcriptional regulator [Alphaproteobacteria bacterium]MBT4965426.1 TetR/AcrR family transcriptional regulator [Alphaproteobacteria bacterium]MBT5158566.1 TetR/AcrR family transcriptional regulator [Alphaproteobacteria bacterium]MBT5918778.1 TetR/AcrR family transcriptional regulator [Alphaproteobacteria bacterium]
MKETPNPGGTGRQDRAKRVISAAVKLFVRRGYEAVSLDEIAITAAIETDVLIADFGDKEAVAIAMMAQVQYQILEPLVKKIADAHATPQGKLVGFINGLASLAVRRSDFMLLMIRFSMDFKGRDDKLENRSRMINSQLIKIVDGIIGMGAMRGAFRTDIDRAEIATFIVGGLTGMVLEWWRRGETVDGVKATRTFRRIVMRGLEDSMRKDQFADGARFPGHHP